MHKIFYIDFRNKKLDHVEEFEVEISKTNKDKLKYFSNLLDYNLVQVLVNTTIDGVRVPDSMKGNRALALNWSHRFGLKDFKYDYEGISGTLSFSHKPFHVFLPWDSVWLISAPKSEDPLVKTWKEHVPEGYSDYLDI